MNDPVDAFLDRAPQWQAEMKLLRQICLGCGLTEALKWGKPCYAFQDSGNIIIIQGFREYCALLFFRGVLLSDSEGILQKTGENTRVGRQVRFTTISKVKELAPILKAYIYEAIKLEKAGVEVDVKPQQQPVPEEFQKILKKNTALKKAFTALTPGRQRAYLIHFAQPKQSATRVSRIEKCTPRILEGRGLNDR